MNRDRHVRKYRTDRNYKNKLECFTCRSIKHLANTCPKRYNAKTRNAQLVEEFNEALLKVDEYMSDNESIYSIVSIDIDEGNKEEDSSNSEGEELIDEIGIENLDIDDLKINLMNIIKCEHNFEKNTGLDSNPCNWCRWYPSKYKRAKCNKCFIEGCISCIETQLGIIT